MVQINIQDYTPELTELARWSEDGCAVFDWHKLTKKQWNAIKSIMWLSGKTRGDIDYWEFVVRVIGDKKSRIVTVLKKAEEVPEDCIY